MLRGAISFVIVGCGLLAAVVLFAVGPRGLDGVLPPRIIEALAAVMEPGTAGRVSGGDGSSPSDYLDASAEGLVPRGPVAAGPGNAPVFIEDVITGYTTRVEADIPAEIMTVRPILGCRLTAPSEGTVVGHVASGASGVTTALATYSDADLAAEVQAFVDVYRETGASNPALREAPAFEVYDVAVTETRSPVYLVLATIEGRRLWNIHLAEGARIERVVLLGGAQAGVANLDPVVPVEVILGEGLAACGIAPAYPPDKRLPVTGSPEDGGASPTEGAPIPAATAQDVKAYDIWFSDSFGPTASESRTGYDAGTIAMIGPVPGPADPKAIYAPMLEARIRTTQDQFFEIRGQVAEGQDFAARVRAIATTFAFGNLENLRQGVRF